MAQRNARVTKKDTDNPPTCVSCKQKSNAANYLRCPRARSWGFHTLSCGCRYGTEDLLLPHARASSRRGYDPDGSGGNGPLDPLIDILPEPVADPRGRARSLRRRRQVEGLRRRLVLDEGREAQLKLDTQPTAGGRTLVDADRIKAARIGDPRWRRSDRARLPTADQAIHASDGSSQGSTCQRAVSLNLFFSL
ncbi:hypothetical protein EVAR_52227_1 [Eumeta japonica]|uniref:Uncharacterized protein n=1 Tax=Eumeta variegata TaxID=151549 RepID=A0A4C1Z4B3_EUMVA|nr:hypothetical protein EVAR_52227_1 [Eumeta japonica]